MTTYDVHLGDLLVGRLAADEAGRATFRFAPGYRRLSDRPVLGQYFEDFNLGKDYVTRKRGLPPFFANLMPEGGALRRVLERTFGVPEDDDLALLSAIGSDLPGAVTFRPSAEDLELEDALVQGGEIPGGEGLQFSLAGVQMKFSVLAGEDKITLAARDELGDWILKLDAGRFPGLTRNEYAVMSWAEHAGFDVPPRRLVSASDLDTSLARYAVPGSEAYLVERFDRRDGQRVHQEDFAQVFNIPPHQKYEHVRYGQCIAVAGAVAGEGARIEMLRRTVFMVASGNSDAHLKNLAFLYPDGVRAELAPLYDQVSTVAWRNTALEFRWALKMANTKDPFATSMDTFRALSTRAGLGADAVERIVLDTLDAVTDAWRRSEAPEAMPPAHLVMLRDYWHRSPLLADRAAALD